MAGESKNLRSEQELDAIDRRIVDELQANGRIANSELAEIVGVAPSTCIARVRGLVARGVITGFTANVNTRAIGLELQVLVNVSVRSGARGRLAELTEELRALPGVLQVFYLGGVEDFIVHLAARDSDHVRDFVTEYLSSNPAISSTRTSLVFSHSRNPVRTAG